MPASGTQCASPRIIEDCCLREDTASEKTPMQWHDGPKIESSQSTCACRTDVSRRNKGFTV